MAWNDSFTFGEITQPAPVVASVFGSGLMRLVSGSSFVNAQSTE